MIGSIVMPGAPWVIDVLVLAFAWLFLMCLGLCMVAAGSDRGSDESARPAAPVIELGPRQQAGARRKAARR